MDGIFICGSRPKSKSQVKDEVKAFNGGGDGFRLVIESTSLFGGYDGSIENAPAGTYSFVGPDPYKDRRFYGTLVKNAAGVVSVK